MRFLLLLIGFIFIPPAQALPTPTGPVILSFSGHISEKNTDNKALFDREMLEDLPQHSFITSTPWLKTPHKYSGVSAVDILKLIGGKGTILRITALNKYVIEVPISDFVKYGAIFSIRKDDQFISIRNLGPIMVMYPFDSNPTLQNETFYWRAIWQANTIEVLTDPTKE
ncbi:MAG: hypothetical protein ACTIM4_10505 [Marinomonas sp.]